MKPIQRTFRKSLRMALLVVASGTSIGLSDQARGPYTSDDMYVLDESIQTVSHQVNDGEFIPQEEVIYETSGPRSRRLATGCDATDACYADVCEKEINPLFENISVFAGIDGSKQPQDLGVNALLGGRIALNWGIPIVEAWGIGLQIGSSVVGSSNAVRVFDRVEGTSGRLQSFSTVAIFQRFDWGFKWSAGYDVLYEDYYDQFTLGQYRFRAGYDITARDEVGIWGALQGFGQTGFFSTIPVRLNAINQVSAYIKHTWKSNVQTTAWGGMVDGHGTVNVALGDPPPDHQRFLCGANIFAPLNDYLAIWGETNLIFPADTGTVDAYLGIAFYPGGAVGANDRKFAPLLPVASSTSFSVDATRSP